jgi:hypothetical protein
MASTDTGSTKTTAPDHPYFYPLSEPEEKLAAFLHRRWQEHEAVVAQWSDPTPRPWESLEPDQQRGYRAMAMAAMEAIDELMRREARKLTDD